MDSLSNGESTSLVRPVKFYNLSRVQDCQVIVNLWDINQREFQSSQTYNDDIQKCIARIMCREKLSVNGAAIVHSCHVLFFCEIIFKGIHTFMMIKRGVKCGDNLIHHNETP